ncbi:uncharacterized protein AKAW2_30270S [Aspergillus luchuensis]|uniref:Uncharacterized protein n=1 Tax=Aspergillus kawachii TaxID=1069201 RepID=A0A7R7ZXA4_ASPKA|nr:uncharacterized protein AKAW2_30270S [Aspergillus luchuensis]BCR96951.1 hypothetical protein AKAW2_30270S [Aspergillus luchuensis]BCS09431.1 hypothetical protein ALUC_30248S [Aspergillus luchuensis]
MFTDVSSGFLEAARKRFAQRTSIEYSVLDITRDPLSQGLEPESYDLIVAANVIHATPSLHDSLTNIKKLLAPGGRLLLQETCGNFMLLEYVMQGFLPGWWVGENDQRVEKPYVNVDRWRKELLDIGLSGVDFTTHQFNEPIVNMASTRPIPPAAQDNITLLVSEHDSGAATEVSRQFRSHGSIVELCGLYNLPRNSRFVIVLLDVVSPLLYNLDEEGFQQLKDFILGLSNHHECVNVPKLCISTLEVNQLDDEAIQNLVSLQSHIHKHEICHRWTGRGREYALVKGVIHTVSLQSVPATQEFTKPIDNKLPKKLSLEFIGLLDTLVWREHSHSLLGDDEVEIDVRCVGLNFRDIAISYGLFGYTEDMGYEGSGVVRAVGSKVLHLRPGDRVMFGHPGSLCTRRTMPANFAHKIPDTWSFEKSAGLIVVYATVIWCLAVVGALRNGQTGLVHSACGGVGLAAIRFCEMRGAQVYTTVGSEEKVQYLVNECHIPRSRILLSRYVVSP